MTYTLHLGDCFEIIKNIDTNSIDAIITDPPYGLGFMNKDWDKGIPGPQFWKEVLRTAKPGAHMLAFGGTRTFHRLAVSIEDAGWEIRDTLGWLYGEGFPKGINIGKHHEGWDGWNTTLKPAWEPIILARKAPEKSILHNVKKHGTGAINIDACRIEHDEPERLTKRTKNKFYNVYAEGRGWNKGSTSRKIATASTDGRWPANILHDGSEEILKILGDAERFFYTTKSRKKDRNEGLKDIENTHPSVKPTKLMQYLCKLITPTNGIILDPFMGSGSTGKAAMLEDFHFIGIKINPTYLQIAQERIEYFSKNKLV